MILGVGVRVRVELVKCFIDDHTIEVNSLQQGLYYVTLGEIEVSR